MRINLSIENASAELLAAILPFLAGASHQPNAETVAALQASRSGDVTRAESVEDAIQPEPDTPANAVTQQAAGAAGGVSQLIAKLDSSFKRAKTVTLKGGAQGKEGDYVTTEGSDEEGLIEAVYRGRAVVSFEDGSFDEYGSSTLTLVPASDESKAPAEPAPAEPASAEAPRRRRQTAEPEAPASSGDPEADEVYAKAAKLDPGALNAILKEFDMASIEEFADLEGDDRVEFIEIIREEAAQ